MYDVNNCSVFFELKKKNLLSLALTSNSVVKSGFLYFLFKLYFSRNTLFPLMTPYSFSHLILKPRKISVRAAIKCVHFRSCCQPCNSLNFSVFQASPLQNEDSNSALLIWLKGGLNEFIHLTCLEECLVYFRPQ